MLFDENDMLSASELNRNPSRYVALAMLDRRQVIIRDNVPVGALIGMDDLRRLDSLDNEEASRSPQVLAAPDPDAVGVTIIGTAAHQVPIHSASSRNMALNPNRQANGRAHGLSSPSCEPTPHICVMFSIGMEIALR